MHPNPSPCTPHDAVQHSAAQFSSVQPKWSRDKTQAFQFAKGRDVTNKGMPPFSFHSHPVCRARCTMVSCTRTYTHGTQWLQIPSVRSGAAGVRQRFARRVALRRRLPRMSCDAWPSGAVCGGRRPRARAAIVFGCARPNRICRDDAAPLMPSFSVMSLQHAGAVTSDRQIGLLCLTATRRPPALYATSNGRAQSGTVNALGSLSRYPPPLLAHRSALHLRRRCTWGHSCGGVAGDGRHSLLLCTPKTTETHARSRGRWPMPRRGLGGHGALRARQEM